MVWKVYLEAQVVGTSLVQKLSFTATIAPSSGNFTPAFILTASSSACFKATSSVSVMKALNFSLNDRSRGNVSETSSTGEIDF